ncbi:MAG: HD domain-containing protein [Chitinophagales bacterium]|jgi:putative hydrolase of HD superfamily|nr:HD domain-containing protein [Sphingobacteriales bacterium]
MQISNELIQQFEFIKEIDKVKSIYRKSKTFSGEKYENDAEHSWHICLMAMVLSRHSNDSMDVFKVIKMLLIHDIVEIDVGDTFLYSENRNAVFEKEKQAAKRIFGLLPETQKEEFFSLWLEFEEKKTAEAKFAGSIDRLQPILANFLNDGITWKENGVKYDQVIEKNKVIDEGTHALWDYAQNILNQANNSKMFSE